MPITMTGGRIPTPGAVHYTIAPQTPAAQPFLPSVNGSLAGTLRWDPARGGNTSLAVPIEWSQVRGVKEASRGTVCGASCGGPCKKSRWLQRLCRSSMWAFKSSAVPLERVAGWTADATRLQCSRPWSHKAGRLEYVHFQLLFCDSQVPMEAMYRLGVELTPAWNAETVDHHYQPALHIFGVSPDTCPPGTYLKTAPQAGSNATTAAAAGGTVAGNDVTAVDGNAGNTTAAGPEAQLSDLHLLGPSGVIELSTQFQPNTTVYGAMVPEVGTIHQ